MKVTITDLGERLQMLRKAMDLSQKDLAAILEVQQNQISRLENGKGGNLELLFELLTYYSETFQISYIFLERFEVVKKTDKTSDFDTFNRIAIERLKLLKIDVSGQIGDVIGILETAGH